MLHNLLKSVQTLHQLGNGLGQMGSLVEILQAAADAVALLLPADRVALIEVNEGQRVEHFVRGGPGRGQIDTISSEELRVGLTGWVLREGAPALSPKDVPDDRESPEVRKRRRATNCGAIIVVPLLLEGAVIGTLTAINGLDQPDFSPEDVEVMVLFANYCAVVIGNAKLILELRHAKGLADLANERLRRQNETKNTLFTILAHDLRGPVGNLSVVLSTVLDQVRDLPDYGGLLVEGEKSARQTYNLLDNLLGWIRGQMDGLNDSHTRFPVQPSLDSVRAWLSPQAVGKSVALDILDSGLMVWGDPGMFETILRNLVSNAIKYSPAGAVVRVAVRGEDAAVVVEVSDQGRGIPPATLASLFQNRRVSPTPGTGGERGTGLGLMFCSDLAQLMGGRIEAESSGSGSRFRLVVPDVVPPPSQL